jgi:predicted nucleotidyltransferase
MEPQIPIDKEKIAAFCQKWKIVEFSLFGSVLTDAFRPDSDVDVLVEFAKDARWGMWDLYDMEEDLKKIFGRNVDLMTRRSVTRSENYLMRNSILSGARTFYAA